MVGGMVLGFDSECQYYSRCSACQVSFGLHKYCETNEVAQGHRISRYLSQDSKPNVP